MSVLQGAILTTMIATRNLSSKSKQLKAAKAVDHDDADEGDDDDTTTGI